MIPRMLAVAAISYTDTATPLLAADEIPQTGLRVTTARLNTTSGSQAYQVEVAETKQQQRI